MNDTVPPFTDYEFIPTEAMREALAFAIHNGFTGSALIAMLRLAEDPDQLVGTWNDIDDGAFDIAAFLAVAFEVCDRTALACTDCEEPAWQDEGRIVTGSQWTTSGWARVFVCEPCADDNYWTCERCGWLFCDDHDSERVGDDYYCERCRDNYLVWCDQCEEYDHESHDHEPEQCECEAPHQHFLFPANGHGQILADERLTVELPAGTISPQGIKAIYELVHAHVGSVWIWTTIENLDPRWQTRRGNFTRRLSSALYKEHEIKLESGVLAEVGNLARQHTAEESRWDIAFTRDLNLSADDFYNDDSCWWHSHSISRCALKNWGGLAIRTFDGDRERRGAWPGGHVQGRAWVQPLGTDMKPTHATMQAHAYLVYNGYGDLEGYAAARVVAHLTSRTYRKVSVGLEPQYVNSDSGYLIADEDTCNGTDSISFHADAHDRLDGHHIDQEVSA